MANEQGQADWFGKDVPKAPEANGLSDTERAMILVGHYAGLAGAAKQALIELRRMSSKEGRPLWVKEIGFNLEFQDSKDAKESRFYGIKRGFDPCIELTGLPEAQKKVVELEDTWLLIDILHNAFATFYHKMSSQLRFYSSQVLTEEARQSLRSEERRVGKEC